MNIQFNIAKLQETIEYFSNITKIDICVLDKKFNTLALCDHNRSFCHTIQNHKGGKNKCDCSDSIIISKCKESLKAEIHVCHAGLTDIAVPIVKDKTLFGFIILGRIRTTENFDEISNRLMWIDDAKAKLSLPFEELIYFNQTQIKSISKLVTAITMLILSENIVTVKKNELAENIEKYIVQNIDKKLSVTSLCDKFHISKNTLYEYFHFYFNMTVSEYITQKRIEKAKQLLIETDIPISDIAHQCGFNSYTYFFEVLKQQEGVTPKFYRTNLSTKSNEQ